MADSASLLRLLEPAVRPVDGGKPAPAATPGFDAQPFEDLLAQADALMQQAAANEAEQPQAPGDSDGQSKQASSSGPLAPLADLGAIESASLREMVGRRAAEGAETDGSDN